MIWLNDNEPSCAAALQQLRADGLIGECVIDDRDMREIDPAAIPRANRYHLCAGIGGFELACQLAGWPDEYSLLTAGFPCQPFSSAGRKGGTDDDRYLWPAVFEFIGGIRPQFILLENSTGLDREPHMVLDVICSDLESAGYEVPPPFEVPACGVEAPHIRHRVAIMAYRSFDSLDRRGDAGQAGWGKPANGGSCGVEHSAREQMGRTRQSRENFWADREWIACHDEKHGLVFRPVKPGLHVLAHGIPARVGQIRGTGNAIVPPLFAEVLKAMMSAAEKAGG